MEQQNFKVDDLVSFMKTASELDGKQGVVLGKGIRDPYYPEYYIVALDEPLANGDKALLMTEACLRLTDLVEEAKNFGST